MRKRYALLNWPRRDPRHYRFAMPNKILEYKLKPVEFVIFSYLCYRSAHGQGDKLTSEVVAEGVRLSMTTVKKYVIGLVDRGLITSKLTFAPDIQLTGTENFFTLPNEIFLLELSSSVFFVYAYLLLIEDRRTHTCHPSYNTIAAVTGLSKNTEMKSISVLLEAGLITAESSNYFDKRGMKWKGNNLYTILPIGNAVGEFYHRQFRQLDLEKTRHKAKARLSRRCTPCVAFSGGEREVPLLRPEAARARFVADVGRVPKRRACTGPAEDGLREERRRSGMSEFSARKDGNRGSEARGEEEQEKAPTLYCAGAPTSARSAGSFQGRKLALL